jgi:hypothetical protein
MVVYTEACESGSIFDGLLPDDANIFVTTAANGRESSWGCYCPGQQPAPPLEYTTCLGDKYRCVLRPTPRGGRPSLASGLASGGVVTRSELGCVA